MKLESGNSATSSPATMSAYQPQPQSQPQHQHGRSPSVSPSPSTSNSSNSNPSTPVSYHSQLRASASGTTPASSIITTATATATVSATTSTTTQHRQANLLTIVGFPTGEDKRNQITQQSLFGEDKQKNLRTQKYPGEPLPLFLQVLGPAKKSEPRRLLIRLTKTRNPDAQDGQGGASGSSEAGSSSNWRSSSSPSVVASASMTATVNSSNPSSTAAVAPASTSFSSPSVGLSSSLHRATLRSSTSSSASSWESDGPQVSQDSPVPGLGMGLGLNSELSESSSNVATSSTLIPSSSSVVIEDEVNIYIAMEKANIHRDDDWVQIPVKKWIKSIIRPPAGAIRINDCHRPTKAPIWYQWHEGPSEYYDLQLFIANSQGIMDGFTIHASFEEHQNVDVTRQRYQSNRTNNKLKTSGDRMGAFSSRHSPYPLPDHSSIANEFGSGGPPGSASISDDFYDELPNSGLMPHPHSIPHTAQHFPSSQPLLSHPGAGQYHAVPYAPHAAGVPGRDPHDPMLSMDRDIREITMSYLSPSEWPPGFERLMQDLRTVLLHPARHPNEKDLDHASIRSWAAAVVPRDLDFTPISTRVIVGLVDSAIHMEVTAKMIRALAERYGISQNLVLMKSILTQVNEDGLLSGRRSASLSSSGTALGPSASPQGVVPVEIHKILNSILSIASLAKTRNQHRFILMLPWIISGNFSSSLEKTIQYAVDCGVLVIASAGDFGGAVNVEGNNASNGTTTWVPAGLPSVLTVGALRSDRSQWRLSNYVVGVTPSGASTTSSNGFPTPDMFDPKNPAFHLEIGQLDEIVISTSIAAVLTAMKAAYLWSRNPNQGAAELRIGLRFGHTLPTSRASRPPFAEGLSSSSSSVVPMNISTSGTELDRDAILSAKQLSPPPGHMPLLSGYGTMSILDGDPKVREVGMCMTTMALEQVNSLINYIQQHDTHLVEQSNLLGAQRTLIQLRSVLLPDFAGRNNVLTHPTIPEMSIIAGDYQVTRTLATGTFATVLLCLNLRNQGYYAVKVLDKNDIIRLQHEDRVNTEKLTHSRSTHPFIVKLYGAFQDSKRLYFVMEYVPGGDLHTIIRKFNRLPPDHAKFYAVELVLAIKYLHELNIIHRDIKPENILIDAAGHIRLTDFGFAKQLNPSSGNDKSWTMCGTPEYMAPEVVLVKGHGKAADWWSFGIVIYEMLEGAPPFRADSIFEVFDQITACKLMIPQHFLAVIQDLLQRLLVPDPNKRIGLSEITLHPWFAGVDWNALLRSQQQLQQQQQS